MDRQFLGFMVFCFGFLSSTFFDVIFDKIFMMETAPLCFFPFLLIFTPITLCLIYIGDKKCQNSKS